MQFQDAVKIVLSKYIDFSGRARRSEYWWFVLFNILVSIVATIIDSITNLAGTVGPYGLFEAVAVLALFLPGLAVGVRRLHDTDRPGWWLFIALIPLVGVIVLLVWFCTEGGAGPNRFGADPKGRADFGGNTGFGDVPGYGQPGGYGPGSESGWGTPPGPPR